MLRGELTSLRARVVDDVAILHAELYEDVAMRVRADTRPWVPVPPGPASPYWVDPEGPAGAEADAAIFSVDELASGELAGEALLWGIDLHNRSAHLGISLRPASRGRGLGLDVVSVLCRYGFAIRGLHRLQLETLADNHRMIAVAATLGFTREGTTRGSSWVNGGFADDVIFGLLAEEFSGLVSPHVMIINRGGCLRTMVCAGRAGRCPYLGTVNPLLSTALATAFAGVAHRFAHSACGKLQLVGRPSGHDDGGGERAREGASQAGVRSDNSKKQRVLARPPALVPRPSAMMCA